MAVTIQGGPALNVSVDSNTARHEGGPAIPVAVVSDGRAAVAGPARRVIVVTNPSHIQGGPAVPVVSAPVGARVAAGPALRVYVVPGGGILDTFAYTNKINAMGPIGYWPMAESSGAVALDASGNGRNGAYTGVTLGQPGIGDGRTAAGFDGATSFANIYSASLAAAFNGPEGSILIWAKVANVGVWSDGVVRRFITLQVDANNRVYIEKVAGANTFGLNYVAGGTAKSRNRTTSTTALFHAGLTWNKTADQVIAYFNGVQEGAVLTGLGVWAGALAATNCNIGANATTPTSVWSGIEAHAAIFARALSAAEVLGAATL